MARSRKPPPPAPSPPSSSAPELKVNAYHLPSLKAAFDQAVISALTGPDHAYTQTHTHTDIKLALGFAACAVALGSTGWVWLAGIGWEESKAVLRAAVGAYALLSLLSVLYAWRVEKGTVFVGKKKTLVDGRIETSHLTLSTRTVLGPASASASGAPAYAVRARLRRSTNAGKSLLQHLEAAREVAVGRFAGADGGVDALGLAGWVGDVLVEGGEGEGKGE